MVCSRRKLYFDRHIERIAVFALISLALLSFIGSTFGQKLAEEEPIVEGSGFNPDDEDYGGLGVEGSGVPDEPHSIYGSHNSDDTTSTSSSTAAIASTTSPAGGRPYVTTRKPAQKPSHKASSFSTYLSTPLLALMIGLVALLLLIVFVTMCCCCRKKRRRSNAYTRGTATSKTYV